MAKKGVALHEFFEYWRDPRGRYTKIVNDMMTSPAWASLSTAQMGLYLLLKAKFRGNNRLDISFPRSEYCVIAGYKSPKGLYRDMDALINKGFVDVVRSGKAGKDATIYGFADRWKEYGISANFKDTEPGQHRETKVGRKRSTAKEIEGRKDEQRERYIPGNYIKVYPHGYTKTFW